MTKIAHYFDYKSPYAYLAQEEIFRLDSDTEQGVEYLPYTLDIPSFLGAAELDDAGHDTVQTRNAHQWRRVRYSYMDCRREANRRGLSLRGPQKIFNSSVAHIGFLYAKRAGNFKPYHDWVFKQFWLRNLDIENPSTIKDVLEACGVNSKGFLQYLKSEGPEELLRIQQQAEALGVFGVPSYLIDGELFWGSEHIARVRELAGLDN